MPLYLLDSSSLSLDEFCFRSRSRKFSCLNSGKYRDVVDAFRTIYWFHGLRIRTNARTTYQMEKILEPEAFQFDSDGDTFLYRRNKWNGYRMGKHTPSTKLIDYVNERFAGTKDQFEHVLWDVLSLSKPATQNVNAWISRLEPDIQKILWRKSSDINGARTRIQKLTNQHLKMIERRASFDALACLTILLREAHEIGHQEESFKLARSLCRVMLLIGDLLHGYGIVQPLYEYYETFIFPLSSWHGKRLTFRGVKFMELVGYLHHGLYHLEGVSPEQLNEQEKIHYKLKLLNGNYGMDYFLLLNPIETPESVDTISEKTKSLELNTAEIYRQKILEAFRIRFDGREIAKAILTGNPSLIDNLK